MTDVDQISFSALTSAAARAAHPMVDSAPLIFADPLAGTLLADRAEELISYHRRHGTHPVLAGARVTVTTRSRYTEECLAAVIGRGVTQYVILGAGLDSFACRSPLGRQVRVFEVDHPGTQRWKRQQLRNRGIDPLGEVSYVEADLGAGEVGERLADCGFDPSRPAFVSWLGVSMYLTRTAVAAVLAVIGRGAPGTELVAEYAVPEDLQDAPGRDYVRLTGPAAAERGEPWHTFLRPAEIAALMNSSGFGPVTHVRQQDVGGSELWRRTDGLRPGALLRLARAQVRPAP